MSDLKAIRESCCVFAKENLVDLARELIEWQDTAILCDGKVRELAKLVGGFIENHDSLRLAESFINWAALHQIAAVVGDGGHATCNPAVCPLCAKHYPDIVAAVAPEPDLNDRATWTRQELYHEIANLDSVIELANRNTQMWKDRALAPDAGVRDAAARYLASVNECKDAELDFKTADAHTEYDRARAQLQKALSSPPAQSVAQGEENART